jgi:1-deoxy-D-xylulose-5-phosphate synthase
VPGLRIAAPRDEPTLRAELREAAAHADGPTVLRFPKTTLPPDLPAQRRIDSVDVLSESSETGVDVLLVAIRSCAKDALEVARLLQARHRSVRVVDPRWVLPLDPALINIARDATLVVTIEDGVVAGGVGSRVSQLLRAAGVDVPTRDIGVPATFLDHGSVPEVRTVARLDPATVSHRVLNWHAGVARPSDTS